MRFRYIILVGFASRITANTLDSDPQDAGSAIIDGIGKLMSSLGPMMTMMGGSANVDLRETLCKSFSKSDILSSLISSIIEPIFGNPNGPTPQEKCEKDDSGGSGPFKAKVLEDPSLPDHTIYVPENPGQEKLPIIAWANGFCLPAGMMFANFLSEIASHGFIVISNGGMKPTNMGSTTKYPEQIKAIDVSNDLPTVNHRN
jgi:hypothetical protein